MNGGTCSCHTEQVTEARQAAGQGQREKAVSSTAFPNHAAEASVVRTNKVNTVQIQ